MPEVAAAGCLNTHASPQSGTVRIATRDLLIFTHVRMRTGANRESGVYISVMIPKLVSRALLGGVIAIALGFSTERLFAQGAGALWETHCIKCHGKAGQGGGAGTQTLLTDELFDQSHDRRFFDVIRDGHKDGGMPGFADAINNAQAWALVNYIRELQHKDLRDRGGSIWAAKDPVGSKVITQELTYTIKDVPTPKLRTPWAVDFLPGGGMLITERGGRVRLVKDGTGEPLEGVPGVRARGQGGMMEVAVHPDYERNGWIYLGYSHGLENETSKNGRLGMTKVVRGKIKDNSWIEQDTIFEAREEHYQPTDLHFGIRLTFTPPIEGDAKGRRHLYFGIGERGREEFAQDLRRPNGKVYRVWDDGTVPADNPFAGKEGVYEQIWSYGHRNPQGLMFDLEGNLWDTEHGPRGGDELNLIQMGRNYGWNVVSFGINYSGTPYKTPWLLDESAAATANIAMPQMRWMPSVGVCGLDVVRGPKFAKWKGNLLAGGLAGQSVDRIIVKEGAFVKREEILHGIGRVRDVAVSPSGDIYVVLNDPDKVVMLEEVVK
jgi:glucose/arabinose dehydrogenase